MAGTILLLWGDQELQTLWALPSLRRLRAQLPEAHLQLVAGQSAGGFIEHLGLVDELLPLQVRHWSPWFLGRSSAEQLRETEAFVYLSEASLVINWLPDVMGVFERQLHASDLDTQKLLQAQPFEHRGEPAQLQLGRVLEALALFAETEWEPLLEQSSRQLGEAGKGSGGSGDSGGVLRIVLEPWGGREHEHWPLERWDVLVRGLLERLAKQELSKQARTLELWLLVPEVEAQSARARQLQELCVGWERWAGELAIEVALLRAQGGSLLKRFELLDEADLYLGQNRSTSQLALACEVPSLLLLGMEQAELRCWQPQGAGHMVSLPAPQGIIGRLAVAEALAGLERLFDVE